MQQEKRRRSLMKALSWRLTGSIATFLASWGFTGQVSLAASISGLEFVSKIVLFYAHERLWEHLPFGRERPIDPEYHI